MLLSNRQTSLMKTELSSTKKGSSLATATMLLKFQQTLSKQMELSCRGTYIAAYDVEGPSSFLITIPEGKAQEILG